MTGTSAASDGLRPSKIVNGRYNNPWYNKNNNKEVSRTRVLEVSYLNEIDDQNVLLALQKLRSRGMKSRSSPQPRGGAPPMTPPREAQSRGTSIIIRGDTNTDTPPPSPMSLAASSVSSSDQNYDAISSRSHPNGNNNNNNNNNNNASKQQQQSSSSSTATAAPPPPQSSPSPSNNNSNYSYSYSSKIRIPSSVSSSFSNITKNIDWEKIRNFIVQINCLGEETKFEDIDDDGFASLLREEGGRTFDETLEGDDNTFEGTLTYDDITALSSLIDNVNQNIMNQTQAQLDDDDDDDNDSKYMYADADAHAHAAHAHAAHAHAHDDAEIISSSLEEVELSSFLKTRTSSYKASDDYLEHDDYNLDNNDDYNDDDDDNDEYQNEERIRKKIGLSLVQLEQEVGLLNNNNNNNNDNDNCDNCDVPRSLIILPTSARSNNNNNNNNNYPLDEIDDNNNNNNNNNNNDNNGFENCFEDDHYDDHNDYDSFSLLTTDIDITIEQKPVVMSSLRTMAMATKSSSQDNSNKKNSNSNSNSIWRRKRFFY